MDDTVKGDVISDGEAEMLRHCKATWYTSDGQIEKVTGDAFKPHPDGVSVTWLQFFSGSRIEQLSAARQHISNGLRIRPSHRLAVISVRVISDVGSARGLQLHVEHDPILDSESGGPNPGHCLIKGVPIDDAFLHEALALKASVIAAQNP